MKLLLFLISCLVSVSDCAPFTVSLQVGASANAILSAQATGGVADVSVSAGASANANGISVSAAASANAHVGTTGVVRVVPNLFVQMGPVVQSTKTVGAPSVPLPTVDIPGDILNIPGPMMVEGVNLYFVWYGSHTAKTKSTIRNFVNGLGNSKWWTVTKAYTDYSNKHPTNSIRIAKEYNDYYSQGKFVTQSESIIQRAISRNKWPIDPKGIYFVLLAADVDEAYSTTQGFCKNYCGYHATSNIKWGLIGNGEKCPCDPVAGCSRGCIQTLYRTQSTNPKYSINGNQGADSMINILAHEITETVTDYFFGTWMDGNGWENADKCNQIFLTTKKGKGGIPYNVDFGKYGKYLIQSNWDPINQKCALSYTAPRSVRESNQ
ncbi:phosphate-induced protein 1 conserved region-domain-containing protein [Obelidium mucronatum]|nr:phosphate-induced protein 1 conserved region-domain-containing protein [Obelidium mucronatum]